MGVTSTTGNASTYIPIATYTVGTAQASYTFSNIPNSYTDLVMVGSFRSDTVTYNHMNFTTIQLNGDTGANYAFSTMYFRNTTSNTINGDKQSSQNLFNFGGITTPDHTSGIFSPYIVNVLNYSNNSTWKTVLTRISSSSNLSASDGLALGVGNWESTAVINSISFTCSNSGNFVTGSTFNLYGIKAAG